MFRNISQHSDDVQILDLGIALSGSEVNLKMKQHCLNFVQEHPGPDFYLQIDDFYCINEIKIDSRPRDHLVAENLKSQNPLHRGGTDLASEGDRSRIGGDNPSDSKVDQKNAFFPFVSHRTTQHR